MDKKSMTLAMGLLLLAGTIPAVAYHIDGNGALAPNDPQYWTQPGAVLIVCESNGLGDVRNANPTPNSGVGGLCTAGETATGTWGAVRCTDSANCTTNMPSAAGTLVSLDACDVACSHTLIGFSAELGAYGCTVPSGNRLVYDALYSWWSYDGSGTYAAGYIEDGSHGHVAMFIDPLDNPNNEQDGQAQVINTGVTLSGTQTSCGSPGAPVYID